MKKALLIIDVQKSSVTNIEIVQKIESLQESYQFVFASRFVNKNSPLLPMLDWKGYDDETLGFKPAPHTVLFDKNIYSSFIPDLKDFDEVHLCGFDTDACIYKTAMDLIENNIRPIVLTSCCDSQEKIFHEMELKLIERNIGIVNML